MSHTPLEDVPRSLIEHVLDRLPKVHENLLAIGPDTNLSDVLREIALAASDVLHARFCVVQPYDNTTGRFLVDQFTPGGDPEAEVFRWTEPRDVGSARTVLEKGELVLENYNEDVKTYPFLAGKAGAFRDIIPVQASLGLRLEAGGEPVGVLFVNYAEPHHFESEELSFAKLFAGLAALAIRNARFHDQSQEYSRRLGLLLEIAEKMSESFDDPHVVVLTALEEAVDLFGVTRGAVAMKQDNASVVFAIHDSRPGYEPKQIGLSFPISGLQESLFAGREPIVLEDIESSHLLSDYERAQFLEAGIKSSLLLPMIARGRVLGSIGLDETGPHTFTEQDIFLGEILSSLVANAVDNARIFGLAEEELRATIEIAQKLMAQAALPGVTLSSFLQFVIDEVLELLGTNAGWLLLGEGNWAKIVATDERHVSDIGRRLLLENSITGESMRRRRPIHIPNLTAIKDDALKGKYRAPLRDVEMGSELVVPLLLGDRAIGAFNIESQQVDAFRPRHIDILSLLSSHVALAVDLAQTRAEAEALAEGFQELASNIELQEVVRSILERALVFVPSEFGQVLLLDENTGGLEVAYTTNDPPKDVGMKVRIDKSVSGLAFTERNPVIVADVSSVVYDVVVFDGLSGRQSEPRLIRKTAIEKLYQPAIDVTKSIVQAEFAVPLLEQETVVGVLNVETSDREGFNPSQRADLERFAIEYAHHLSTALAAQDQQKLMALLQEALAIAKTDFGQILRLHGRSLIIELTTGAEARGTSLSIDKSVTGRAVRRRRPVYVPEVGKDPEYERYLGTKMASELAVPLMVGDRVLGVLNLESPILDFFTARHARILQAFASQAAVAIERARTHEDTKEVEIGLVAGDIVHRLNNPIGAMRLSMSILRRKDAYNDLVEDYPFVGTFLERMDGLLEASALNIQSLRELIRAGDMRLQPVVLQDAIEKALHEAELPESISVGRRWPKKAVIVIANGRLVNVFWNLFDNAHKFMPNGGHLDIAVEGVDHESWVVVTVSDTGSGIEPWRLPLVFEQDQSTTRDEHAPAHGLGLWWVDKQVKRFGGIVEVSSEVGVGTKITLRLKRSVSLAEIP